MIALLAGVFIFALACSSPTGPAPSPSPSAVPISPTVANLTGTWKNTKLLPAGGAVAYGLAGESTFEFQYQFGADGSLSAKTSYVETAAGGKQYFVECKGTYTTGDFSVAISFTQSRISTTPFTDDSSGWTTGVSKTTGNYCLYDGKLFAFVKADGAVDGLVGTWVNDLTTESSGSTSFIRAKLTIAADKTISAATYSGNPLPAAPYLTVSGTWAANSDGSISATMDTVTPSSGNSAYDTMYNGLYSVRYGRIGDYLVMGTTNAWDGGAFTKQ